VLYRGFTDLVGIQPLEEIHHLLEEVADLLLRVVVRVAAGLDGVDARAVLVPFVLPEALVVTLVVLPVGLHVVEQLRPALRPQDGRDVAVLARRVAVGSVGAVAVVGPEILSGIALFR